MGFPVHRMRRLRRTATIRQWIRETTLTPSDLVQPLFVVPGKSVREEIGSMPGQYRYSVDQLSPVIEKISELNIPGIILFGIPESKDEEASGAWSDEGIVQQAIRAVKEVNPELVTIADVCLCEYMSHGHCGVVREGRILNDPTLALLSKTAVSLARAGADVVAPSDMMDGRIGAIRNALDEAHFGRIIILSYAVKYASAFYGPFREAADSAPQFGDRKSYQMDPANAEEALREVALDLEEGADMILVKPGLAYLDVLYRVKREFARVTGAYQVSGEYAMIEAASANDWIDRKNIILETLTGFKRAGADFVITYHAMDAAEWLES